MATNRAILEHLSRPELRALIDGAELEVADRRVREDLIKAAASSRKIVLDEVLARYPRERLKELGRALGLDDGGKEKAPIVARLLGCEERALPLVERTKPSNSDERAAQSVKRGSTRKAATVGSGDLGFEAKLWQAADKLRNNMDAAEYKHVVLGLIFLKYISDAFEELHACLIAQKADGVDPENPHEYRANACSGCPERRVGRLFRRRPRTRASASALTTRWRRLSATTHR